MKKTIFLLYCIMFVSTLCAQRLNHQGKKMVRSVTSFAQNSPNRKDTIRYNFYYDDVREIEGGEAEKTKRLHGFNFGLRGGLDEAWMMGG